MSTIKDKVNDQIGKMAETAGRKFNDATEQAGQFANRAAEEARHVGGNMQEVAGNLQGAVDRSVRDQPMATLAMAAVVGFVLGAIWKS